MEPTLEDLNAAILLADSEGDAASVEELVAIAQKIEAEQQASQGYQPTTYDMGQAVIDAGAGIVEGIQQFPKQAFERAAETFSRGGTTGQLLPQIVGTAVESYILNPISEALKVAGKGILELTPDSKEKQIADTVTNTLTPLLDTPLAEVGIEAAKAGIRGWTAFAQNNPVQADTLKGVFQVAEVYKPPMFRNPVPYAPSVLRKKGVELQRGAKEEIEENVRADLEEVITPLETAKSKKERQEQMYTDEKGVTRYRRTKRDEDIIDTLKKTEIGSKNSNQKNQDIVTEEIEKRGARLSNELREYDWVKLNREEVRKDMRGIINNLLDPTTGNPALAGETQAKTAKMLFTWVDGQLGSGDITPSRLHSLRKEFDAHIRKTKSRSALEGNETAFAVSQKAVRDYLNSKIIDSTPLVETQEQLKDLHNLYRAKDVIKEKAAEDANTAMGRTLQNIQRVTDTTLPKSPLGKIVTVGAVGSFALSTALQSVLPFAATATVLGGLGYAVYRGSVSPDLRKHIGKTLVMMDKIAKNTKSKEMREALALDRATLVEVMKLPTADVEDLTEEEKEYKYPEIPLR
tara:strand:- start:4 stop:1728 length:1725 start_codon:yes stop_codon:yes gene_type:complete